MFLRDARRIGTGIGIAAVITGGMAIVAVLLMAHGSSTISDSIHTMIGICMVIATAIRITDLRAIMARPIIGVLNFGFTLAHATLTGAGNPQKWERTVLFQQCKQSMDASVHHHHFSGRDPDLSGRCPRRVQRRNKLQGGRLNLIPSATTRTGTPRRGVPTLVAVSGCTRAIPHRVFDLCLVCRRRVLMAVTPNHGISHS